MVTKTRAYSVDASSTTHSYTQVGNNPIPPAIQTRRTIACVKSMTHPGGVIAWKNKIQNGVSASTGFTGSIEHATVTPGLIVFEREHTDVFAGPLSRTHQERSGCLVGTPSFVYPGSISTTSAQDQAKQRFLQKCLQAQTSLQTLVCAGELGEALRMIRRPGQALFNSIFDYIGTAKKRRRRAKKKSKDKVVADTWLEYAYGWAPLVSDIHSGVTAINRLAKDEPPNVYVKGFAEVTSNDAFIPFVTETGIYSKLDMSRNIRSAKCIYRGVTAVQAPGYSKAASVFGVQWSQVVPTAWELIPYSFLVDYFSNIGAILNTNAFNQASLRWFVMTVIRECKNTNAIVSVTTSPTSDPDDKYTSSFWSPSSIVATSKLVDRSPGTGSLALSLSFKLPWCDTQWLNIAALATAAR